MSVKVMGRVWDTTLAPNLKLVLLAYADAGEHDGTEIWPGETAITSMTSYSRSQVERLTRKLLDIGVLVQVSRGHKGRRAAFFIDLSHDVFTVSQDATLSGGSDAGSGDVSELREGSESCPFSVAPTLHSDNSSVSHPATLSETFSVASGPFSVASGPFSVAWVRHLPSCTPVLPPVLQEVDAASTRRRDLVWEALVEIHGEPATKSERGKLNRVRGKLAEANVDHVEYPALVAAYMAKFSKRGSAAPQPTAMTIAERVGELRHFVKRGPIGSPGGDTDDVLERRRRSQMLNELKAEFEPGVLEGGRR